MKIPKNLGLILLGVWLILFGILSAPFLAVRFNEAKHTVWRDEDPLVFAAAFRGVFAISHCC